ncbi:MAG: UvrD-helicase domain-containing protein [Deferrisomatales bacterium]|nr:UvrD-helicase domain-containing protein [Deferrisomatales bacterium]
MTLEELNERQREAVTHREGPLLVLAGAGSGKTRVITHRIAHLLRRGVPAQRILALSFTNKAAREVAERVEALAGRASVEGLTVSTFHSLGLRVLREDAGRLGLDRHFSLHGEADQRASIRELVREAGLPLDASEVQEAVSFWKNRGILPGAVQAPPGDGRARVLRDVYRAYQDLLRAHNAVDFDDLLLLPLGIFRESPDCLARWQHAIHYLLVDEYQDTNPVQFELLKALAGRRRNLCVVGDDDQAIYGWRGAEVGLILRFEEHFPGARVVLLEENYRSTSTVLEAAHAVVSHIPARREKRLWTGRGRGDPVGWIAAEDARAEAEEVASAILAETFRTRRPWSHFVVLYRTNAQARPFEEAFRAHAVPYRVVGGSRFFDRKEVRDVLSYLKAMHNPRDDASLLRIANVPKRGLGPQALLRLKAAAEARGESLRRGLGGAGELSPQARAGANRLLGLLETYGRRFREEGLTPAGLRDFYRDAGLRAEVEATYDSPRAVARRLELLEELAASTAEGPRVGGRVDLGLFVERLSLDPPADRDGDGGDEVALMTLHSAKGLEFPVVFLAGMEEGLLPLVKGADLAATALEEERRLCYVGMTRARERLVLCHARTRRRRGHVAASVPSRFLSEVPLGLTEQGGARPERSEAEERAQARSFFHGIRELLGEGGGIDPGEGRGRVPDRGMTRDPGGPRPPERGERRGGKEDPDAGG